MTDLYVDTPSALTELCHRLRGSPWIALDTEFIREKTYYPELCLMQLANEELVACVDPLALTDLDPLMDILYDRSILKVLHSAYQDLEIFFHLRGAVPSPVFDTQVAATLLGQGDQVGYANLVSQLLGVALDKSQTRTDWRRRPLNAAQLSYAGDDVRYLRDLYRQQHAMLSMQGRLDWPKEDFEALCAPSRYRVDAQTAWRRIKGHQQLRSEQLAVLEVLAAWREERASSANRPRRWILGDAVLLDMAQRMPTDSARLEKIRGLGAGALERHGKVWLALIAKARGTPSENWPQAQQKAILTPEQEALVDAMMALAQRRGTQESINVSTLVSRKQLEQLLVADADIPLLHGWRAAVAGREVQALLRSQG